MMHFEIVCCEIQICVYIPSVSYLLKKMMICVREAHVKGISFTSERFKTSKVFGRNYSLYL